MKMRFEVDGREHAVASTVRADGMEIAVDGRTHATILDRQDDHRQTVTIDGRRHRVVVASDGDRIFVHAHGRSWEVRPVDPLDARGGTGAQADQVMAPMPGTVVSVAAVEGATVAEGDPILVIESMKLETTIRAPRRATVKSLPHSTGESFDKGALLVSFAPEPDAGDTDGGSGAGGGETGG